MHLINIFKLRNLKKIILNPNLVLISINYNFKVDGRIGYFKVEILKATSPFYFDNKRKF